MIELRWLEYQVIVDENTAWATAKTKKKLQFRHVGHYDNNGKAWNSSKWQDVPTVSE